MFNGAFLQLGKVFFFAWKGQGALHRFGGGVLEGFAFFRIAFPYAPFGFFRSSLVFCCFLSHLFYPFFAGVAGTMGWAVFLGPGVLMALFAFFDPESFRHYLFYSF